MARRDPLTDPGGLIRRVYSYVAYRIGDGPDAEDITGDVFERAVRYRSSYDPRRGEPLSWLVGIARRCIDGRRPIPMGRHSPDELEQEAPGDLADSAVERLAIAAAMSTLDERSRDLLALRYGADLSARQIGAILGLKPNAVDVALHRALGRLRSALDQEQEDTEPLPDRRTEASSI
jgi:RNA polymerase sigma-70 factor (ECF subfamily)